MKNNKEIPEQVRNDKGKKILAFDTCLDKMYAVLKEDDKILSSKIVENHDEKYHSAFLISTLQEILSANDCRPEDIDLIVTNTGPGSFTGIRACTTVARVMAQQLHKKVAGVSSLEILAEAVGENPLVALDARKNSAYLYCDGEIKGAVPVEEVLNIIKNGNYSIITDNKLKPLLGGISYQEANFPLGEILAKLGEEKIKNTDGDWRKLKPLYIQPPPMG